MHETKRGRWYEKVKKRIGIADILYADIHDDGMAGAGCCLRFDMDIR